MTIRHTSIAPYHVSFYVAGSNRVEVPVRYGVAGVFGTAECLVVTCLNRDDGDTSVTVGPIAELPATTHPLRFDGTLETPDGVVLLFDVNDPEMLSISVREPRTRLRIWTNHPVEPDEVVIGFG